MITLKIDQINTPEKKIPDYRFLFMHSHTDKAPLLDENAKVFATEHVFF